MALIYLMQQLLKFIEVWATTNLLDAVVFILGLILVFLLKDLTKPLNSFQRQKAWLPPDCLRVASASVYGGVRPLALDKE